MAKDSMKECTVCKMEIYFSRKEKPENCPFCGEPFWDKPNDERQLFILQEIYIRNGRDPEDLGPMYLKLIDYSKNIIKHKLRNSYILPAEDFNSKSISMSLIMIERFLKDKESRIQYSFGGMLQRIANGVLFGEKKDDQVDSLNDILFDGAPEVLDSLKSLTNERCEKLFSYDPQSSDNLMTENDLIKDLKRIVDLIYNRVYKKKSSQNMLFLVGLNHFLTKKKDTFMREYNNIIYNQTRRNIENSKLVIRKYLLEQVRR